MKLVKVEIGERYNFTGTFEKFSRRYDKNRQCSRDYFIIKDITDVNGNYICKYASFDNIQSFERLKLSPGDRVFFRARVVACQPGDDTMYGFPNPYSKVYNRLMNPTKVGKLTNPVRRIGSMGSCMIDMSKFVKG